MPELFWVLKRDAGWQWQCGRTAAAWAFPLMPGARMCSCTEADSQTPDVLPRAANGSYNERLTMLGFQLWLQTLFAQLLANMCCLCMLQTCSSGQRSRADSMQEPPVWPWLQSGREAPTDPPHMKELLCAVAMISAEVPGPACAAGIQNHSISASTGASEPACRSALCVVVLQA